MSYDAKGWNEKMRSIYRQYIDMMRDHGPHEYRIKPPEKPHQEWRRPPEPHYRIERIAERMPPDLYQKSVDRAREKFIEKNGIDTREIDRELERQRKERETERR